MIGLPDGEPVKGKTYRADGWAYLDTPTFTPEMWDYFLSFFGGSENYVVLAQSRGDGGVRGHLLVSPDGVKSALARREWMRRDREFIESEDDWPSEVIALKKHPWDEGDPRFGVLVSNPDGEGVARWQVFVRDSSTGKLTKQIEPFDNVDELTARWAVD